MPIQNPDRVWLGVAAVMVCAGLTSCSPRLEWKTLTEARPSAASNSPAASDSTPDKRLTPPAAEEPVDITSDRMEYTQQGQVTLFTGHVVVTQGSLQLFSPYLEVRRMDGLALAKQGVRVRDQVRSVTVTAQEMEYVQNLTHIIARTKVRLDTVDENGIPLGVTSQRLEWKAANRRLDASGGVQVTYRDITATAEAMSYQQVEQTITLARHADPNEPWPTLVRGSDTITGESIIINTRQRTYEVRGSAQAVIAPPSEKQP